MKKLVIIALYIYAVMLTTFTASAATEWHTANQTTIAWDQEYTVEDVTIPTDEVTWDVFIANATTDPDKTNPVKVGTATEQQYTITLNTEGKYIVGVQTVRTVDGKILKSSTITWSDSETNPFGIKYFVIPDDPYNIRIQ